MNNPLLAFQHKRFNASHYKQPIHPQYLKHNPQIEYGPFITNEQLHAMTRLPFEQKYLNELENKLVKNKKYMLEQYEDRDILLPWLSSPDYYYQLALTHQLKLENQLEKQQKLVLLLQSQLPM